MLHKGEMLHQLEVFFYTFVSDHYNIMTHINPQGLHHGRHQDSAGTSGGHIRGILSLHSEAFGEYWRHLETLFGDI